MAAEPQRHDENEDNEPEQDELSKRRKRHRGHSHEHHSPEEGAEPENDPEEPRGRRRRRHQGHRHRHFHQARDTAYWRALSNTDLVGIWIKEGLRHRDGNLAKRTRDRYESTLHEFARYLNDSRHLTEVKRNVILDYKQHLATNDRTIEMPKGSGQYWDAPLGASAIKNQLAALRHFYRYLLMVDEERQYDPTAAIDRPKVKIVKGDVLNREEASRLMDWCNGMVHKEFIHRQERFIVCWFLRTGHRVDELRNLHRGSVDLQQRVVTVVGKGDKTRTIDIGPELLVEIESWYRTQDREAARNPRLAETLNGSTPWLLTNSRGDRLSAKVIWQNVKRRAYRAGVRALPDEYDDRTPPRLVDNRSEVTCHMLRRTFGTNLLERGCELDEVADILGHQDVQTTRAYYLKPHSERRRRAMERLDYSDD